MSTSHRNPILASRSRPMAKPRGTCAAVVIVAERVVARLHLHHLRAAAPSLDVDLQRQHPPRLATSPGGAAARPGAPRRCISTSSRLMGCKIKSPGCEHFAPKIKLLVLNSVFRFIFGQRQLLN